MGKKDRGPQVARGFAPADKTPKVGARATLGERVPKAQEPNRGWNEAHPVWCFRNCDRAGEFPWSIAGDHASDVLNALRDLGCMTWREILIDNQKHYHAIEVPSLSKAALARLVALKLETLDEIVSFRLASKLRFWAIRIDHYAFLLWWDPEHKVYPVEKHNT